MTSLAVILRSDSDQSILTLKFHLSLLLILSYSDKYPSKPIHDIQEFVLISRS